MKIKNYDGRSWISKLDAYNIRTALKGFTVHITNAEVEEAELKGTMLVVKIKK
jgi:hypothetical protein